MALSDSLKPRSVWNFFEEICQIPRPSKHEEKIAAYLMNFAASHNLSAKQDHAGNVLICKPASAGYELSPVVVLQSHMDMVCEKNSDVEHDFFNDPIKPYIQDGWVTAGTTTLGADCGIGMAAQLAILADPNLVHPALEALFTVDEETGLTGAAALESDFVKGRTLINLDSEDEGELFIGCAGGIDTTATLQFVREKPGLNKYALKISISGLLGGHSGDDINKERGNAIKILNRLLTTLDKSFTISISEYKGGNLRNAIAREASAVVLISPSDKENVTIRINEFRAEIENELLNKEPGFKLTASSDDLPGWVFDNDSKLRILQLITAMPHGVLAMSYRMPGMVETSTNLASIRSDEGNSLFRIVTSQRSDLESGKMMAAEMVAATCLLAGATPNHGEGYCGWAPNPSSPLLKVAVECYEDLFSVKPIVRSIHAGLECGLFSEKFPAMDMISFGPTLRGVHSPDEKIEIASVEKFWQHLLLLLSKLR